MHIARGKQLGEPGSARSGIGPLAPYLAGGAAVLILGVGIGAVIGQDDPEPDQPAADSDPETGDVDDGSETQPGDGPTETASAFGQLNWEVVTDEPAWAEGRDRQAIRDLTYHDGTITAAADGRGDVVIYTSPDGHTWDRYPDTDDELSGQISRARSATTTEHGTLVAGTHHGLYHSHPTASVWTSSNSGWERIEDDVTFERRRPTEINGIADTSLGTVAVGLDGNPLNHDPAADADAAAWRSTDGHTWESISDPELALGGPGDQYMNDVVEGGPGLIAVGADDTPDTERRAAVWTYTEPDGWERTDREAPALDGPGSLEMNTITTFDEQYVAVGQGGDASAGVWTSPDGRQWERIPDDPNNLDGDGTPTMLDVTDANGQLIAVGTERFPDGHSIAAAWLSDDAHTWERIEHEPELFDQGDPTTMTSVIALDERIVIGGHAGDGRDIDAPLHPVVWIAQ